jgi:hypothetical protein
MPRSKSRSAPTTPIKKAPPPPTPPPSPTPISSASGSPSMLDSLKHGMGVGAGLELSRQVIQGLSASGNASSPPVSPTPNKQCELLYENMMTCIHDKDFDSCGIYIESYRECKSQQ